jgi:hypothetical protein
LICRALTNQLLAISRLKQKLSNGVSRKVRKAQHQNPEFGHKQDEINKKPAKSILAFNRG